MSVFLVNLKPKEIEREDENKSDKQIREDYEEIFEFCQEESIFGTAWPLHEEGIVFDREGVEPLEVPADKEEVKSYMKSYDKFTIDSGKLTSTLRYLYTNQLQDSILVHHHRGSGWYLAKVPENADVEYKTGQEFSKHFMFHVIEVEEWKHVNPQHLPSSILRSTSQGGAIKKKRKIDDVEEEYLRKLYEGEGLEVQPKIGEVKDKLEDSEPSEVLKKIGPNEMEDVILAYLQFEKEANSRGNPVLWQSSYTSSLPEIEYNLKHVDEEGEEYSIFVQVKTGKQKVKESEAEKFSEVLDENDKFYIYQESGTINNSDFIELDEKELYEFLKREDNLKKMPSAILYRLQKSL